MRATAFSYFEAGGSDRKHPQRAPKTNNGTPRLGMVASTPAASTRQQPLRFPIRVAVFTIRGSFPNLVPGLCRSDGAAKNFTLPRSTAPYESDLSISLTPWN
jgi:hypothetical protein